MFIPGIIAHRHLGTGPKLVGVTTKGLTANSVTTTVDKPTGTVENDLIIVMIALDGTSDNPTITGFTSAVQLNATDGSSGQYVLYKTATASEPATYTVNWASSEKGNFHTASFRGMATTSQFVGFTTQETVNVDTLDPANYTGATIGNLIIGIGSIDRANDTFPIQGPPANMQNISDVNTDSAGTAGIGSSYKFLSTTSYDPSTFLMGATQSKQGIGTTMEFNIL